MYLRVLDGNGCQIEPHRFFLAFLGPNDPVMIVLLALRSLQLALFHHLAFVRGFEP